MKYNYKSIRVWTETQKRLKLNAAMNGKTMIEFIDWLLDEHEERIRKEKIEGQGKGDDTFKGNDDSKEFVHPECEKTVIPTLESVLKKAQRLQNERK